jgi:hypothetical protein
MSSPFSAPGEVGDAAQLDSAAAAPCGTAHPSRRACGAASGGGSCRGAGTWLRDHSGWAVEGVGNAPARRAGDPGCVGSRWVGTGWAGGRTRPGRVGKDAAAAGSGGSDRRRSGRGLFAGRRPAGRGRYTGGDVSAGTGDVERAVRNAVPGRIVAGGSGYLALDRCAAGERDAVLHGPGQHRPRRYGAWRAWNDAGRRDHSDRRDHRIVGAGTAEFRVAGDRLRAAGAAGVAPGETR